MTFRELLANDKFIILDGAMGGGGSQFLGCYGVFGVLVDVGDHLLDGG